ncbi:MAG: hypothetical protein JNG85_14670 [Spirochaetaceae bacterium]|nr:hypothetical protein [Spirochaetaceae bacterium]
MNENKALTIIADETARGALIFAAKGIESTAPLYKAEATVLHVTPADFHTIQGKLVGKKETCDRIGEAAGVDFVRLPREFDIEQAPAEPALDLPARAIFVGHAQGRVRAPDGSWRMSTVETYAFDYYAKALAEEPTDLLKRKKKAMEYYKAGPMRAATGARLRVIRQLTGMPTAFEAAKIGEGMGLVFSRIVQNTDMILSTPEGRRMATAVALGLVPQLFGPQGAPEAASPASQNEPEIFRTVSESEGTSASDQPGDFGGEADPDPFADPPPPSASDAYRQALVEYEVAFPIPPDAKKLIDELLAKHDASEDELRVMVERTKKYLVQKGLVAA